MLLVLRKSDVHPRSGNGHEVPFFRMEECARMNCDKAAVALLTFAPQQAKAWLYDLDEPDPSGGIMLCRKHANATVVPMSWQLVDGRDPAWPGPSSARPDSDQIDIVGGHPIAAPASAGQPEAPAAPVEPRSGCLHQHCRATRRPDANSQPFASRSGRRPAVCRTHIATLRAAGAHRRDHDRRHRADDRSRHVAVPAAAERRTCGGPRDYR